MQKDSNFVTTKILEPDEDMARRVHILDTLLGNSVEARELKQQFLKIAVVHDQGTENKLVNGRATGKERKRISSTDPNYQQFNSHQPSARIDDSVAVEHTSYIT